MNFKDYLEQSLSEAIKDKAVIISKRPMRNDPSQEVDTMLFSEKEILAAVKKRASKNAKKHLMKAYMDGPDIVHPKTNKTIAMIVKDDTIEDVMKKVEDYIQQNHPAKEAKQIDVQSDTRAIVAVDSDTAATIKKEVHNTKAKIKVRVMARKDGAKVYIDTADKDGLDSALEQVNTILGK
jgi:hypothetical protein